MEIQLLLVEDDSDQAELVRMLIRSKVHRTRVDTAPTLEEAKYLLKTREYHIAVLDLNLPDGSGLEILDWLRDHPGARSASATTVVYSSVAMGQVSGIARSRGAAAVFPKTPDGTAELVQWIGEARKRRLLPN